MRNLFVEIYLPDGKVGFVAEKSEEIRAFLLCYVPAERADRVIANLEEQRLDPRRFPNMVLVL